ncbi:MAG TPA: NAD(P)H-dependent oxidoreductase [Candidatus Obscuribacterales bacterium]
MADNPKILCFAGSLRKGSLNKKLVKVAAAGAEAAGAKATVIDLKDFAMPIYDGDIEEADGIPENAKKLKRLMKEHQGLILSCPEYNSSITGVLKNVIDWCSRPEPGEPSLACFTGKVAGLTAASPGALGGLRGLVTVRSILGNIGVIVIPDQVAVPGADKAFDDNGKLKDEKQQSKVEKIGATVAEVAAKLNGLALK